MASLNQCVEEYALQLRTGRMRKAYRGILAFLSALRSNLARKYPEYVVSAIYAGYLDMSFFAVTPPEWKQKGLKIAVVYLHEQNRFEVWLGAVNRTVQKEYFERFSALDVGNVQRSTLGAGVDSILLSVLDDRPDFDRPEELMHRIEMKTLDFIVAIEKILNEVCHRGVDRDGTGGEKE